MGTGARPKPLQASRHQAAEQLRRHAVALHGRKLPSSASELQITILPKDRACTNLLVIRESGRTGLCAGVGRRGIGRRSFPWKAFGKERSVPDEALPLWSCGAHVHGALSLLAGGHSSCPCFRCGVPHAASAWSASSAPWRTTAPAWPTETPTSRQPGFLASRYKKKRPVSPHDSAAAQHMLGLNSQLPGHHARLIIMSTR